MILSKCLLTLLGLFYRLSFTIAQRIRLQVKYKIQYLGTMGARVVETTRRVECAAIDLYLSDKSQSIAFVIKRRSVVALSHATCFITIKY